MTEDVPQNRPKKAGGGVQSKDFTHSRSSLDQTESANSKKSSNDKDAREETT